MKRCLVIICANDSWKRWADMNAVELIFEHKGRALITQRSRSHGNLTHFGRAVTIHSTRPYGLYDLVLHVAQNDRGPTRWSSEVRSIKLELLAPRLLWRKA